MAMMKRKIAEMTRYEKKITILLALTTIINPFASLMPNVVNYKPNFHCDFKQELLSKWNLSVEDIVSQNTDYPSMLRLCSLQKEVNFIMYIYAVETRRKLSVGRLFRERFYYEILDLFGIGFFYKM